jgi:uncharacterized membrane protein
MKEFIISIITAAVVDFVWLGLLAKKFYRTHLGPLARIGSDGGIEMVWGAVIPIYILMALGVTLFVLPKANGSLGAAAGYGALFGLITYGVYDLTNFATLKNWSLTLTLVDMAWGAVLCAIVALAVTAITK